MAQRGLCSRREADRLIAAGRVLVAGAPVCAPGLRCASDVEIRIQAVEDAPSAVPAVVLLHKPVGYQSGPERPSAYDCVPGIDARSHAIAGRLDRASSGLLVLTSDGRVARRLTADHDLAKVYQVDLHTAADTEDIAALGRLRQLDGAPIRPMVVTAVAPQRLRFVLHEGRKHQIRRACRLRGLLVAGLHRLAIGPWQLGDLAPGAWCCADPQAVL